MLSDQPTPVKGQFEPEEERMPNHVCPQKRGNRAIRPPIDSPVGEWEVKRLSLRIFYHSGLTRA